MPSIGIFQDIFAHTDKLLATFALEKSHALALMLDPVVTPILGITWITYGAAHLTGQIEEPFMSFVDKTIKTGLIVGAAMGVAGWNDLLIQTVQDSPVALAAALAGTSGADATLSSFGTVLDGTMDNVVGIASNFFSQWITVYPIVLGALVLLVGIVITVAAGFFIFLSKVATAIILSLAPLFILCLLFQWSKNYFASYLNTLNSYALLGVIAVGTNSFILSMFQQVAGKLVSLGGAATIIECASLLIAGVFGGVVLWQVPSMASGLASGMSLATAGIGRVIGGGAWNKATNKQGRDNQRDAKNQIDIQKRKDKMSAGKDGSSRNEVKQKRKENLHRRTGTNN